MSEQEEIGLTHEGHVALMEMRRPPHNFVDIGFVGKLADMLDNLDRDDNCRAIVLCSGVSSFCAGADFSGRTPTAGNAPGVDPSPFYGQAMRLFRNKKPIVVAVNGPAIGAGMGLTLVGDFRIACQEARFSANFNRLGFHPGFGMSVTLPHLIGPQKAALLFYTGRRINGAEALAMGLVDELVPQDQLRQRALELAQEIAASAPLAVESTRDTLRQGMADRIVAANQRELAIQLGQFRTEDFREGVAAMSQRRLPEFQRK
ncbi:enoyl-CoA hydratase/isomerase family protein [Undibacterium sp. TJN25]|uniref:enoyl-CoA hydratase/isomerase family protein n=1 Tax=Undibacterium sp. TJN25 TaxID=3413056 RepID=UPI003BF31057